MAVSKGKEQKFWTMGLLLSRGWTREQAKELLPIPTFRTVGARRVRTWRREDVLRAERSDRFTPVITDAVRAVQEAELALHNAQEMLKRSWSAAELPDTDEALLARHYNSAIAHHLRHLTPTTTVGTGKASSYLAAFLALEHRRSVGELGDVLRRFVMTGVWLGSNPAASMTRRVEERYPAVLLALATRTLADFRTAQPEADLADFLRMPRFPVAELLSQPLSHLYSVIYIPRAIRSNLELLVALNPKDEYPAARAMRRHFILHIGGTNTGKTYAGFQRLRRARNGVYLAPLRLLAMEAQETLLNAGVACALCTGEEEDWAEGDTHICATAEKLDLQLTYEVAVIDECQMIADPQRGYAWTRAILGVCAREIHLCAAPEARDLLIRIIESCHDSYEVVRHERKTPLECMDRVVDYDRLQPGDALITFSKIGVLSVAEDLRQRGMRPAIIYGALPYATRRAQMEGFLHGQMRYVVSTDAIGMGLNLPIRRIIFMEAEKYDGIERRPLRPEEVQQIAGRAGRFGMYDKGYVGATQNLTEIRAALMTVVPPLRYAVQGFSDYVLEGPFDLLEVLDVWNKMPAPKPYKRLDVSRYLTIISRLRDQGFRLDKSQELRAASIPFDETEEPLNQLFFRLMQAWTLGVEPEPPALNDRRPDEYTLPELELQCRKLDLYYSFSRSFGFKIDADALYDEREQIAERINSILLHNLRNNIRFCRICGASLPLHHQGSLCAKCYRSHAGSRRFRP